MFRFIPAFAFVGVLLWQGPVLGQAAPTTSGYTKSERYLDRPAAGDVRCRQDIARATKDLQHGRRVFCWPKPFSFTYVPQYAAELAEVCRRHGVRFEYEQISDETSPGFTDGCYGAVMDRALTRQFGKGFRARWIAQADSLFQARHPAARSSTR
ncbi:hypothetical protein [Hymenobacter arizonensis]|uniref:Uncharacterized protein n=1 Tax=Hymenobacter arizonensis TaxID=1227077 RepID=A0A1I6BEH7_HYMAR|nr:hypothetical protein [Hymenobacter arizonensis]SFQ79343.1 hypothetical protein SAMN04515668_4430 [Hymenobacter arizonensis]